MIKRHVFAALLLSFGLIGCADIKIEEPKPYVTEQTERIRQQSGTFHGNPKGLVLYSTRKGDGGDQQAADDGEPQTEGDAGPTVRHGNTVNPYLWQASLESLDFMPLMQADSGGGVIITDWYAPAETPEERFKISVYILDANLRADALKVAVFRQIDSAKGWVDAPVDKATAVGLEDNILERARELRLTTAG